MCGIKAKAAVGPMEGSLPQYSRAKPAWEASARRLLRLPKEGTNDGALVLLVCSLCVLPLAAAAAFLSGPLLTWAALGFASTLCGLAVQQYVWYTSCTDVECWRADAPAVLALAVAGHAAAVVVARHGALVACMCAIVAILMPSQSSRASLLVLLDACMLVGPMVYNRTLGSLFDGADKARKRE